MPASNPDSESGLVGFIKLPRVVLCRGSRVAQCVIVEIPHEIPIFFIDHGMVLLLGAVVTSGAQTNKPVSIIFPPANWDAGKHILAPFVATNKAGDYPLPFDWAGLEKVTARSGWFTDRVAMAEQTNIFLDFDRVIVWHKPWFRSDRCISSGNSWGPAYLRSLPSDVELLQMRDVSSP